MRYPPAVIPAPHVIFKRVGDEIVLLDYERGIYYGLDAVGGRVWELLGEGKDRAAVIDQLLLEYDVGADELTRDLDALLAELQGLGLLL